MTKESRFFNVERDDNVIIWKFYNPPKNLWTPDTGPEFMELIQDFYSDPELRVAVFTSAMPDVFIAHYDVSDLVKKGETLKEEKPDTPKEKPPTRRGFIPGSKPVIAAINAPLAGGGLELAMSFDFRFMSRTASAAQSEVRVGILPGGGGTQRMTRLVGLGKALELMLTGRRIFPDEAERIGLITRAVDPLELMQETIKFAKTLAEIPPLAMHHTRQCIYNALDMPIEHGLAIESELFQELLKSEDALERMRAFVSTGQAGLRERMEDEKKELERQHQEKIKKLQ